MILLRNLIQRWRELRTKDLTTWEATRRIVKIEAYRGQQIQRRFERRLAEHQREAVES